MKEEIETTIFMIERGVPKPEAHWEIAPARGIFYNEIAADLCVQELNDNLSDATVFVYRTGRYMRMLDYMLIGDKTGGLRSGND